MNMTVWEAMHNIPGLLPILATLAGAVLTTIVFLLHLLKRRHLIEQIRNTELELKRAREGVRAGGGLRKKPQDAVIVKIHDHLVTYQQGLRRTRDRVKISGFILLPFLAGGFFGTGHILRAIGDREHTEHMTAQFQELEHAYKDSEAKRQTREEAFVVQESERGRMAREVEEYARQTETLLDRLAKTEQRVASEKKKRTELEVLLGKAEQRLAGLEDSHHPTKDEAATVAPGRKALRPPGSMAQPDSTRGLSGEPAFEETDLYLDNRKLFAADPTSHYTGKLKGQIAFEGRRSRSRPPWREHHIYVLVRWGISIWIVTDSAPTVSSDGSLKGEFNVILPISTIRTLNVTAIATDKVYRRYQYVRLPEYTWRTSAATVAVHRS